MGGRDFIKSGGFMSEHLKAFMKDIGVLSDEPVKSVDKKVPGEFKKIVCLWCEGDTLRQSIMSTYSNELSYKKRSDTNVINFICTKCDQKTIVLIESGSYGARLTTLRPLGT